MDLLFIGIAFIAGLFTKVVGFPPLIGFLMAGFALNFLGYQETENLRFLADLGITLMLRDPHEINFISPHAKPHLRWHGTGLLPVSTGFG
ncbi:MAG: hypothetical protein GW836_00005, partial [Paraglaciecola sp.]|nr:hypothetical protein [Paraglaciecola sp.]